MQPKYDLDKIKFATDRPTFGKAIGLYENGRVVNFQEDLDGFSAVVLGTSPYKVFVDSRYYDEGDCECYLGQNDILCKHMVALAIYAVKKGKKLDNKEKQSVSEPVCSFLSGELSKDQLAEVKKEISSALKCIKPYSGPSRIWFAYQRSLDEGCARLSKIVSDLPVNEQTVKILVNLLLRLDAKLCRGGVDDSDGTVGGFMDKTVDILKKYADINPECIKAFNNLCGRETCFGWEEPLVDIFKQNYQ